MKSAIILSVAVIWLSAGTALGAGRHHHGHHGHHGRHFGFHHHLGHGFHFGLHNHRGHHRHSGFRLGLSFGRPYGYYSSFYPYSNYYRYRSSFSYPYRSFFNRRYYSPSYRSYYYPRYRYYSRYRDYDDDLYDDDYYEDLEDYYEDRYDDLGDYYWECISTNRTLRLRRPGFTGERPQQESRPAEPKREVDPAPPAVTPPKPAPEAQDSSPSRNDLFQVAGQSRAPSSGDGEQPPLAPSGEKPSLTSQLGPALSVPEVSPLLSDDETPWVVGSEPSSTGTPDAAIADSPSQGEGPQFPVTSTGR